MSIEIDNVNKHFGDYHALDHIHLTVPTGSLTALLGPSGCGKTTLLRIIAGLEYQDSGRIVFDGRDVSDLPVRARKVGFMFQHYALFAHMRVIDNVAFGLSVLPRRERPKKAQQHKRAQELLELVQLGHLAKAYPHQLSGGQRQRVALARALAVSPKLLLLDEPFGALDAKVRHDLRLWLKEIHHELGITSILVTHDQDEAMEVADEIVVMNHGHIEQVGSSQTLYQTPKSAFVADFVGQSSQLIGQVKSGSFIHPAQQGKGWDVSATGLTAPQGNARAFVRPEDWQIDTQPLSSSYLPARMSTWHHKGAYIELIATTAQEERLYIRRPTHEVDQELMQNGRTCYVAPKQMHVFAA